MELDLAHRLAAIPARELTSPWPDHERVRGFGIMSLTFDSGHVLGLRVFPENDFAPYVSVWHRTPDGEWAIYVDGPRLDAACPRYFGPAVARAEPARIEVRWIAPATLRVAMEEPRLVWTTALRQTAALALFNAVGARLPLASWRPGALLRLREAAARRLFGLGEFRLRGRFPAGQLATLVPERMYLIAEARANLSASGRG